jgi:hypothetical protein
MIARGADGRDLRLPRGRERCLWRKRSAPSIKEWGSKLVKEFPVSSADPDPIESAWKGLRKELRRTAPPTLEKRAESVRRLHTCVRTLNTRHEETLQKFTDNSRERCRACVDAEGSRTQY